uniref:Spermatogenesis-associated protein 6 N-terminal domain-containing protein n=1 Tax=Dendroctonus ponderosae TaxID=77166 RepID=A0AAR5Q4P2_DENPD
MSVTSRLVSVELAVGKVTCPGVWLCSNGKISLQIYMMDSVIQTDAHHPNFPILFNEKFKFYKRYLNKRCSAALQRSFAKEFFNAELIQWKNCDEGVILANFCSTLDDLLHPSNITSINKKTANVDVLMEPTKLFPGTIFPKLELRTQTSIETKFEIFKKENPAVHINTKKCNIPLDFRREKKKVYPKKVCHTIAYSKEQQRCPKVKTDKRPIFMYRKPDDNLILRINPNNVGHENVVERKNATNFVQKMKPKVIDKCSSCYCSHNSAFFSQECQETAVNSFIQRLNRNNQKQSENIRPCQCCFKSKYNLCPICSKYIYTFSRNSIDLGTSVNNLTFAAKQNCTCSNAIADNHSEKKVCFCCPEERATNLVQKLHERVINTLNVGSDAIESCFAECTICE